MLCRPRYDRDPGDTPADVISAIIADESAIGMINAKTTAVRLIPVPGKTVGERAEFGGLLGGADIMAVQKGSAAGFINRGRTHPGPDSQLQELREGNQYARD